jgi:hypothetical protein
MNTFNRVAHVSGFGAGACRKARQYLADRSYLSDIVNGTLEFHVPNSMSDQQAEDTLWYAFRTPQVLNGWVRFYVAGIPMRREVQA